MAERGGTNPGLAEDTGSLTTGLEESYGNTTPLETKSPTLPSGRFSLPDLQSAHFPTPPGLSTLRCRTEDWRLGIPGTTSLDKYH